MARRPPSPARLDHLIASGDCRTAEALVRPWAQSPTSPLPLQLRWARALSGLGRHGLASQVWMRVCRQQPSPEHLLQLGQALLASGQHQQALPILLRVVSMAPTLEAAVTSLLQAVAADPTPSTAATALDLLRQARPQDPRPDVVAARAHLARGDLQQTRDALHSALARDPAHAEAHLLLASLLTTLEQLERAAHHAAAARAQLPEHPEPLRVSALIAGRLGELRQARQLLDEALALSPHRPDLLWARARQFPRLPETQEASDAALRTYRADLLELRQLAEHTLPEQAQAWVAAIQDAFPVHYTGGDCLDEQSMHGMLVHDAMTAAFPLAPPAPPPRDRIRVGFVSSLFRRHTITKLFSRWMTTLDPQRFEVVGYHLGQIEDGTTQALRTACAAWRHLPGPIAQAIAAIQSDAPDALIFPELGMDSHPLKLAALRLAPFQAMSWGHPISSGLPNIDAFVACEAMAVAPDRSWTHEARIDLPGIGIDYPRPPRPPPTTRSHFDLPDRPLLLCVQSLQKYRPRADLLHARIARGAPDALLVFVAASSPQLTERFRTRMSACFTQQGLRLQDHVRLLPRMQEADYMRLLSLGDLFLDSPDWSGGNTVLEAISTGLPCLAWPGDTFRGRHCHGIMGTLGLPSLQPTDPDHWVQQAINLAQDADERTRLRSIINDRSPGLFDDPRSTRALEALLIARCG